VADFATQLKERKYLSEALVRYGYAHALLRFNKLAEAAAEVATLRRLKLESPLLETLDAQVRMRRADMRGAVQILRAGAQRYPHARALTYALIDAQLAAGDASAAVAGTQKELQLTPGDARLFAMQAKAYALMGKRLQQHRAQAEAYLLDGQLSAAVEQLELARKAGDGDFYEQSQVDARLRELKQRKAEEMPRR
jgi:predicted Zn-dependent protease